MMKHFLIAAALVCAAIVCQPGAAQAQEGQWRVMQRTGLVQINLSGNTARNARLNEAVPVGTVVTTGSDSHARLENGAQRIDMSANSRLIIRENSGAGMNRIWQEFGSIFFQIDHRQAPHFRVDTPLLAAIVKGTEFTVSVQKAETTVAVTQGLVDVRAKQGDAKQDVPTGHEVHITALAPRTIISASSGPVTRGTLPGSADEASGSSAHGAIALKDGQSVTSGAAGRGSATPTRGTVTTGGGILPRVELWSTQSKAAHQSDMGMLGFLAAAFFGGIGFFLFMRVFSATISALTDGAYRKQGRVTNYKRGAS